MIGFTDRRDVSMMPVPMWTTHFKQPPVTFRPVPFWSWNGEMQPDEVRRQVDLIADAGWGGGFIHSRVGLTTPYLGEAWFEAVDAAVAACAARGLPVWLYDEDRWPSGFNGGTVTRDHPKHRSCYVAALEPDASLPPDSRVVTEHAGLRLIVGREPLGSPMFNGATYLDPLNPSAVDRFVADAYEPYRERLGEEMRGDEAGGVVAMFTDEPAPLSLHSRLPIGALPFTDDLPEQYEQRHNEPLLPKLHFLFEAGAGAAAFRLRYARLVSDLFEQRFSKRLGDWCESNGLAFTGHWMSDHTCRDPQRMAFRCQPQYRHQQIPGIDHLGRQIEEVLAAKQCSSVAHQQGKPRVLSELFGVAGQNLSFEDRRWIALQQLVLGVNLLVPHLALYTMAGCRKRDYPPNLFYQQPWWPLNRVCDEPLSRLCVALSQGSFVADVAVLHPAESAAALWQSALATDATPELHHHPLHTSDASRVALEALDADLQSLVLRLLDLRVGFDLFDEEAPIIAEDGGLRVDQMTYPTVVLPKLVTMRPSTFEVLRNLHGRVLRDFDDDHRVLLNGEPSETLDDWLRSLPSTDSLDALAGPALTVQTPGLTVWTHERQVGEDRLLFVVTLERERAADVVLRPLEGRHVAERLDAETGEIGEPVDLGDGLPLTVPPAGYALWRLSTRATAGAATPSDPLARPDIVPLAPMNVERLDPNALPLDLARADFGEGLTPHAPPVLAVKALLDAERYVGPLTLQYHAHLDAVPQDVALVVEDAAAVQVRVNGQSVAATPTHWLDPRWHKVEVAEHLCAGDNTFELHWPEFVFGDPGAAENARRYGTEPEAIYLIGDFNVEAALQPGRTAPRWGELRLPPITTHDAEFGAVATAKPLIAGNIIAQGLPFYAGRIRLRFEVEATGTYTLEVDQMDAAVGEVSLDGQVVGHLVTRPWRTKLPPLAGRHAIELTLYGTLRNLLGPHHHPHGEMPFVGPHSFLPERMPPEVLSNWVRRGVQPADWHPAYALAAFGDIGQARLVATA